MRRIFLLLGWLGFAACALVLGVGVLRDHWARRELHPIQRGRVLAQRLGCFGCHGPEGGDGVPNPGSATGRVPGIRSSTLMMDAVDDQQIREYILDGYPREHLGSEAWKQAQAAALKMPAYRGQLDPAGLEDLLAYYLSVNDRRPMPEPVRAGRELAVAQGCFACHGLDGAGGLANPGSLKGYVPGWLGPDYAELVADEQELREWILRGTIRRLLDNPAARLFVERQKVQMPPYQARLTEEQVSALVAYIQWLRATLPQR